MGDVLTGVFGGGQQTDNTTTPDQQAQTLNNVRTNQLLSFFNNYPYGSFAGQNDAYKPSPQAQAISNNAVNYLGNIGQDVHFTGMPSLPRSDFSGQPQIPQFNNVGTQSSIPQFNNNTYTPQFTGTPSTAPVDNLMSFQDYQKQGLDQTGNYINQIATPQIMSQLALQGLEGGGAVPEAIAKATASIGLPFVQSLPGASTQLGLAPYQAGTSAAQTNLTGAQTQTAPYQAGNILAQSGLTGAQQQLAPYSAGNILAQTGLTGAQQQLVPYSAANTAAQAYATQRQGDLVPFQALNAQQQAFATNQQAQTYPYTAANTNAQTKLLGVQGANAALPLADYGNILQQQDINRRQNVLNTGLTGLPFTPGSSQQGGTSSQPLFNFFGQG